MKSPHLLAFAVLLGLPVAASAAWTRLPYVESKPVNLASKAIPGTKILASQGIENAISLLTSDSSASAHIAGGKSEVTIQLVNQQILEIVSFVNDGVEGKVTCAGSPDQKNWTTLGRAAFTADERIVEVSFASAQAKYLSISFESAQGGTIRALNVFGTSTGKDFVLKPTASSGGVNLAGGAAGAHAIYAFPAPNTVGELGIRNNVFKFPSTSDKYRTIVYDLGSRRTIREVSTAYSQHPVRLEVFAFQDLPEKKDWRGKLTLDPAIFDETRPIAAGEDARGAGHIKVVPAKPVVAQYIALRFEPNYLHASNGGSFEPSWNDLAQLGLGSAAPLMEALNLLPEVRLTAGDSGFTVCSIDISGTGFSASPNGGGNDTGNGNTGNTATGNGTGPVNDNGAPPYLPGTPGSPPAGTGGLPGSGPGTGTGGPIQNTTINPVTVKTGGGGGTNAGGSGNNNPTTTGP